VKLCNFLLAEMIEEAVVKEIAIDEIVTGGMRRETAENIGTRIVVTDPDLVQEIVRVS
jgi:hypothetical protein